MNGHKLQLVRTGESIRIYYEDWISGENDAEFEIRDNAAYYGNGKQVDLAYALWSLGMTVDDQVKEFYANKK